MICAEVSKVKQLFKGAVTLPHCARPQGPCHPSKAGEHKCRHEPANLPPNRPPSSATALASLPFSSALRLAAEVPRVALGCFNRPWTKWRLRRCTRRPCVRSYKLTWFGLSPHQAKAFTLSRCLTGVLDGLKSASPHRPLAVNMTATAPPRHPLPGNHPTSRKQSRMRAFGADSSSYNSRDNPIALRNFIGLMADAAPQPRSGPPIRPQATRCGSGCVLGDLARPSTKSQHTEFQNLVTYARPISSITTTGQRPSATGPDRAHVHWVLFHVVQKMGAPKARLSPSAQVRVDFINRCSQS